MIIEKMKLPLKFNKREIYLTINVRVTSFPDDNQSAQTLYYHANLAMNEQKN